MKGGENNVLCLWCITIIKCTRVMLIRMFCYVKYILLLRLLNLSKNKTDSDKNYKYGQTYFETLQLTKSQKIYYDFSYIYIYISSMTSF